MGTIKEEKITYSDLSSAFRPMARYLCEVGSFVAYEWGCEGEEEAPSLLLLDIRGWAPTEVRMLREVAKAIRKARKPRRRNPSR